MLSLYLKTNNMKYRPEIDGLRAIAVVPVILYHAGFKAFSGGFIGVDIFFVISGFLITTIIISELNKGVFSIVNFYERRARRIMPILFFIMGLSFIVAWFIFQPSEMILFSNSITAVSTFSSNFLFWKESGYWNLSSELKPLLHTWSLAVEEQFYLLFPLLLILSSYWKKYWTFIFVAFIVLFSLIVAQYASVKSPNANFFFLPTRSWELGLGALIAIGGCHFPLFYKQLTSKKELNNIFTVIGLIMVVLSIFLYNSKTPFPSVYTLLPVVGTGFIILFGSTNGVAGRFLTSKLLVHLGLISYSAYLWHQPLFAFMKYILFPKPSLLTILIVTVLVYPLSYLSWKYIENPFRDRNKFSQKNIFYLTLFMSIFFIILGTTGYFTDGFKDRAIVKNLKIKNYIADNGQLRKQSWELLRKKSKSPDYSVTDNSFDNQSWFDSKDNRRKLLLVGNSHSKDIYNTLQSSSSSKTNFQIARYGVQIRDLFTFNHSFYKSPNYKNSDIIVIASAYSEGDILSLIKIVNRLREDNKLVVIIKNIFNFKVFGTKTLTDFYIQSSDSYKLAHDKSYRVSVENNINRAYYQEIKNEDVSGVNIKICEILDKSTEIKSVLY